MDGTGIGKFDCGGRHVGVVHNELPRCCVLAEMVPAKIDVDQTFQMIFEL